MVGDFNIIRDVSETLKNKQWHPCMKEANKNFEYLELEECRVRGPFLTWWNSSEEPRNNWKRLDRSLANQSWFQMFPHSEAVVQGKELSDHCPLVISNGVEAPQYNTSFKFFNHWAEKEDFKVIVEEAWNSEVIR